MKQGDFVLVKDSALHNDRVHVKLTHRCTGPWTVTAVICQDCATVSLSKGDEREYGAQLLPTSSAIIRDPHDYVTILVTNTPTFSGTLI